MARPARRAAAMAAIGVMDRALATAPIGAEGSRLGSFTLASTRAAEEGASAVDAAQQAGSYLASDWRPVRHLSEFPNADRRRIHTGCIHSDRRI